MHGIHSHAVYCFRQGLFYDFCRRVGMRPRAMFDTTCMLNMCVTPADSKLNIGRDTVVYIRNLSHQHMSYM